MILCANKVDMAQKRIVSSDAGREMARRLGVPYMETSAKDPPQNIDDVFRDHPSNQRVILGKQLVVICRAYNVLLRPTTRWPLNVWQE